MNANGVFGKFLHAICVVVVTCAFVAGATGAAVAACTSSQIDVLGDGTQCETSKFEVTTTNLAANTAFKFSLSAQGTIFVDWGDGNIQTITRSNTNDTKYSHTYETAGTYTIKFSSSNITAYNTDTTIPAAAIGFYQSSGGTQDKIASVSGSLGALFPQLGANNGQFPKFRVTFYNATNLTTIPGTLFSGLTGGTHMFQSTFSGCTSLTTIPSGLFSDITTGAEKMFSQTFSSCTSLTTIPLELFSGITTGAQSMFAYTFAGCTGLTSIPADLFSAVDTSSATDTTAMFSYTFNGCTSLTTIPAGLFSSIDTSSATNTSSMFNKTFSDTGITSIPAGLFSAIDISSATNTTSMFSSTFQGTGITSIPADLFSTIDTSSATNTSQMFYQTFYDCSNLGGYIPPTAFPGTIQPGSSSSTNMWFGTFRNTQLATSCDSFPGMTQYITGFESNWGYSNRNVPSDDGSTRVSCQTCAEAGLFNINGTCEEPKFTLTTTSDATSFVWTMSAKGPFYVDCGDGGTLSGSYVSGNTITRTGTNATTYTCTWGSAGAHTVRFGGTATGYSTSASDAAISFYNGSQTLVASIDGSLGAMFPVVNGNIPRFYRTFHFCSNLTSIPAGLFSGIDTSSATDTGNMFYQTFDYTGLTSIPAGLFSTIDTSSATDTNRMFGHTFAGCTGLTSIPAGLFSAIDTSSATNTSYMFNNTFNHTRITSIPTGLFSAIDTSSATDTSYMFYYTFNECSSLSSIPAGLFSTVDTSSATNTSRMFERTFSNCSSLSSIPAGLFSAIDTSSATDTSYMFYSMFTNCSSLVNIPAGLFSTIDTSSATNTSSMFESTFSNCSSLSSIPAGLFSTIDTSSATNTSSMFRGTFYGCSNLSSYIPPTTFPNTIQPGSSSSTRMWYVTFYNTQLLTVCPVGTGQYITGFESDWGYSNSNVPTNDGSTRVSCEPCAGTIPEHASYVAGTCDWACDSGYINTGTSCEIEKFSVTTSSLTANTTFNFSMSVKGTFYVDCGDGGTLTQSGTTTGSTISGQTITRSNTNVVYYTCTWETAGAHTIKFGSSDITRYASSYQTPALSFSVSTAKIASVSGSLGALLPQLRTSNQYFPNFYHMFYGATNLTSIPSTLFSGLIGGDYMFNGAFENSGLTSVPNGLFSGITTGARNMFYETFKECTNLSGIPEDLFGGITTGAQSMFWGTFKGCSSLSSISEDLFGGITTVADSMFVQTFEGTGITSIPEGLFDGVATSASTLFARTFANCTRLTSVPEDLFSGITTGANSLFSNTFTGCTSLVSIPAGLFSNVTTGGEYMFNRVFYDCTNLSGYIPPTTFAGLIANDSPVAENMWDNAYAGTQVATSCPAGYTQYITGYEDGWGGKVSCQTCAEAGMAEYADKCHAYCSAMSVLHVGNYQYRLLADRTGVPSPVMAVKRNDEVCYLYMEQDDNLNTPGLHIKYDNHTYSPVSLAQPG